MARGKLRLWAQRWRNQVQRVKARTIAAWYSEPADWVKLLSGCLALAAIAFSIPSVREQADQLLPNLYVEFWGLIFDIVFIGFIFGLGARARQRREQVQRYREEIDDFKKWDSDEARCRIAGNIRRLNKLGVTAIDFCGLEISNFSLGRNDIKSIAGSTFYDGEWGTSSGREHTKLDGVSFNGVDCSRVLFSAFYPLPRFMGHPPFIELRDCTFLSTTLANAKFDGAHLVWSRAAPNGIFETDRTEDGEEIRYQTYYPPFFEVDLAGVSFRDAHFQNADFRQAENLMAVDFSGATGLETCVFDPDDAAFLRNGGLLPAIA